MSFAAEQRNKVQLIEAAFALHHVSLPFKVEIFTDGKEFKYRNKAEFSWYGQTDEFGSEKLDIAYFKRGSKGKIVVTQSSIMPDPIMELAIKIRNLLQKKGVAARSLKTLLIRCNQKGECTWQLYVKEKLEDLITDQEASDLQALGGEVIYSDPRSPASQITQRLKSYGKTVLSDVLHGVKFKYATEGFFQINLPVYEQVLSDMQTWIPAGSNVLDLYSGVGSIGLTVGGQTPVLVEINEYAVREMKQNIQALGAQAKAVLAASEDALEYITSDKLVIVDPPRAGLHKSVVNKLLQASPGRIVYLSCNPVTQARDVALLLDDYELIYVKGYNFFPRTPHIENLVVLQKRLQP